MLREASLRRIFQVNFASSKEAAMLKKTFPAIEFATLAITVFLMAANVAEGASSPSVALTGQVS